MRKQHSLILIAAAFACGATLAQTKAPEIPARQSSQDQDQLNANKRFLDGLGTPSSSQVQQQTQANKAAVEAASSIAPPPVAGHKAATKEDFLSLANSGSLTKSKAGPAKKVDLLIFVSTSMPDSMLKNFAWQAREFGAVLMMRGFVDDKMSSTKDRLAKIDPEANWEINPEPFKTFKIDKVPAIVVADATNTSVTEDGCAVPTAFTSVFGDITVASALDKIALRGQASTAPMAKQLLASWRATAKPERVIR